MRKETLYEIYDCMDDFKLVTKNLKKLSELNNNTSDIFLSFCKNGLVDSDNIGAFIDLSSAIDDSYFGEDTSEVVNSINEVLVNDYVKNDPDYKFLIENYCILFDDVISDSFYIIDLEKGNAYYKNLIVNEFNNILLSYEKYDINKLHTHSLNKVFNSYCRLLEDLPSTTSNITKMDHNDMIVKRIQYFVDIVSDKTIYELENKKYKYVVMAASMITNIEKLKLFKNQVKLNRVLDNKSFLSKIDSNTDDVSDMTISVIKNSIKKDYDTEKERETIKKVLKPINNA